MPCHICREDLLFEIPHCQLMNWPKLSLMISESQKSRKQDSLESSQTFAVRSTHLELNTTPHALIKCLLRAQHCTQKLLLRNMW